MKRLSFRPATIGFVAAACAAYLPKVYWPTSTFYIDVLSPKRLQLLGFLGKVACLGAGAFFSFRSARRLGKDEAVRGPWMLLGVWLALWTVGYAIQMIYAIALGVVPPIPSPGDVAFLVAYVPLFAAYVGFIRLYRASGLPVGSARQHLLIAGLTTATLAPIAYSLLAPVARSDAPLAERLVNITYTVMDLAALVPTVVMIRIAIAFRPGGVWAVWGALLLGFLFTASGDFVANYLSGLDMMFDPTSHFLYLLGYFFIACGTKLQNELQTETS